MIFFFQWLNGYDFFVDIWMLQLQLNEKKNETVISLAQHLFSNLQIIIDDLQ